jgi:hypothetical protein
MPGARFELDASCKALAGTRFLSEAESTAHKNYLNFLKIETT